MKVKDAINNLQKLDQESHVIIEWWADDWFQEELENKAPEFWPWVVEIIGNKFDWSDTHWALRDYINYLGEE